MKVGIVGALTVIVIVAALAQDPAVGVNVYNVVVVLFIAGDQVPVIPLVEVVGKAANAEPEQIAGTGVKVGFTLGVTFIVNVVVGAH